MCAVPKVPGAGSVEVPQVRGPRIRAMSRPRFFAPDARPGADASRCPPTRRTTCGMSFGWPSVPRSRSSTGAGTSGRRAWRPGQAWRRDGGAVSEIAPAAEPPVRVTLGIGLLKGDQMDAVVRDATMLGVVGDRAVRLGARGRAVASVEGRSGSRALAARRRRVRQAVPPRRRARDRAGGAARGCSLRGAACRRSRSICVEPSRAADAARVFRSAAAAVDRAGAGRAGRRMDRRGTRRRAATGATLPAMRSPNAAGRDRADRRAERAMDGVGLVRRLASCSTGVRPSRLLPLAAPGRSAHVDRARRHVGVFGCRDAAHDHVAVRSDQAASV